MAEGADPSDKTEEPTPRKLEEARRKGDVAKSADVAGLFSLAAVTAVVIGLGPQLSRDMAESLAQFLSGADGFARQLETGGGVAVAWRALAIGGPLTLAVLCAAALAGAAGNLVQHGLIFTGEKIKPDLGKLSPAAGFRRLFGVEGLMAFGKTLAKLIAVGAIAWAMLSPQATELERLIRTGPAAILGVSLTLTQSLFGATLAFLAVAAALDWLWQRQRFMQRMRMSREELKEEFRQSEGDPHVKAKLKQMRAQKARRRMMANLPKATVVVTNPTHYAIALRYVAGETEAPVCLAKGVDALALRIRAEAERLEIPLVEDPPLARALFATVDIDETIPREHFEAVAKVIGFVMGAKARRSSPPPLASSLPRSHDR